LDQNGIDKPDRCCVQGFLNFYPAGPTDGGLCVIAKSHTIFNKIFEDRPHLARRGDWTPLESDRTLWNTISKNESLKSIKLCCQPGDFVLWDSRTIHSGYPAIEPRALPEKSSVKLPLRRLVAYVCMTPKSRMSATLAERRKQAYFLGWTTSHWPEECVAVSARKKVPANYKPPELTDAQKELLPM